MNVLFIGNAIIDVISHVDEMDQVDPNLIGKMQIVSHSEIINKIKLIPNKKILSGGSSNNSACGLSMLDEKVYFIGKIGNDQYGKAFLDHNKKYHIKTNSIIFDNKSTTGLSLIYVTPDGQRTMYTCPGASSNLSTSDIPKSLFKGIE